MGTRSTLLAWIKRSAWKTSAEKTWKSYEQAPLAQLLELKRSSGRCFEDGKNAGYDKLFRRARRERELRRASADFEDCDHDVQAYSHRKMLAKRPTQALPGCPGAFRPLRGSRTGSPSRGLPVGGVLSGMDHFQDRHRVFGGAPSKSCLPSCHRR